jgi:hypothetical protein
VGSWEGLANVANRTLTQEVIVNIWPLAGEAVLLFSFKKNSPVILLFGVLGRKNSRHRDIFTPQEKKQRPQLRSHYRRTGGSLEME